MSTYKTGTSGADLIFGGWGSDTIHAGAGNDLVYGSFGNDLIFWGAGNDTVYGGYGDDVLDDVGGISSNTGSNLIFGGAGRDLIWDSSGNDTTYGGNGDDSIFGDSAGDDVMFGGAGNDILTGGIGNDYQEGGDGNDSLHGDDGNDNMRGGNGNDFMAGGAGDDYMAGDAGHDSLHGNDGNDNMRGGDGNDFMAGGAGDDYMAGDAGHDSLHGNDGNDNMRGGDGDDFMAGGAGDDYMEGNAGHDSLHGEEGNDNMRGGDGNDFMAGGAGDDYMAGDAGHDLILGEDGNDLIHGGSGHDVIFGGTGNDSISGGTGEDYIEGNAGNDHMWGDDGQDYMRGGDGNDYMLGGMGDDTMAGDTGHDLMLGEDGNDYMSGGDGSDLMLGGTGDDVMAGDAGDDVIEGGAGDDLIHAGSGHDIVFGGTGNDDISGGTGDDYIEGNEGTDLIFGGDGDDSLAGGDGADVIYGDNGTTAIANALNFTINSQAGLYNGNVLVEITSQSGTVSTITAATNYDGNIGNSFSVHLNAGDTIRMAITDPWGTPNWSNIATDAQATLLGNGTVRLGFEDEDGHDFDDVVITATVTGNVTLLTTAGSIVDATTLVVTGGNDVLKGGAGADSMFGEGGNDTFIVNSSVDGAGDVISGGNGPNQFTDHDILDLRGAGLVTVTESADETDFGASKGIITFANGATLHFSQIEEILTDVPADGAFTLTEDTLAFTEDGPAVSVNLLDNDTVEDGVASVVVMGSSIYGTLSTAVQISTQSAILTFTPSAAAQALNEGEVVTEVFTYQVTDSDGDVQTASVTLTITGSNDAPTVTAALSSAAAQDDAAYSIDLLAGASDVDTGAVLSVANVAGLVAGVTLSGNSLSVDPSQFQSLAAGQVETISITYDVTDENGASVAQTATITITGSNDAPTVTAALSSAAAQDDAAYGIDLLAGAADVDAGAVLSVANVAGLVAGVTLSGNSLSVDPSQFQSLAAGQVETISITYDVTDENGASVAQSATITITGSNDAPTVTAALSSAAVEDDAPYSINLLAGASDVDTGAVLSVANVAGLVAGVTLSGNSLSVDPSQFQSLAAGQVETITVTYDVTDENGASVAQSATITITGTNDAPTVVATSAAINEDASISLIDLATLFDDIDSNDDGTSLTYAVTGAPTIGTANVSGSNLIYAVGDTFQSLAEGESQDVEIEITATDSAGVSAVNTVTVTVTGANDGPTFATTNAPYVNMGTTGGAVTDQPIVFQEDGLTYEGWFKWNGDTTEPVQVLMYNGNTNDEGFGVIGSVNGTALDLQVLVGGVAILPTTASLNPDTWYHIALTRDGDLNLYLDGQAALIDMPDTVPAPPVTFGVFMVGSNQDGGETFAGDVAELRVWTVALGQAEIDAGRFNPATGSEPDLTAVWGFGEGAGDIASDSVLGQSLQFFAEPVWEIGDVDGWPSASGSQQGTIIDLGGDGTEGVGLNILVANGSVLFSDIDLSDSHSVSVSALGTGYFGQLTATITDSSTGDGLGGIAWSYEVDNIDIAHLSDGETLVQSYDLQLQDSSGGTVTQTVTITLQGAGAPLSFNIINAQGQLPQVLLGSVADDVIYGNIGDDTIIGNGGDDLLTGGAGADVFVFEDQIGSATILDFETGDRLDLSAFNLADFAALQNLLNTAGQDTQINLDPDTIVVLQDIDAATLTVSDFIL